MGEAEKARKRRNGVEVWRKGHMHTKRSAHAYSYLV